MHQLLGNDDDLVEEYRDPEAHLYTSRQISEGPEAPLFLKGNLGISKERTPNINNF